MKIVSSAKISERHQRRLTEKYPMDEFYFFENINDTLHELKGAECLITFGEDLSEGVIQLADNLKWIQVVSAGVDLLPFPIIKQKGIVITNVRGIHAIPMSEYTISAILQLARKTSDIFLNQLNSKWDRSIRVNEVYGATVGIIGLGAIGQAIAAKARAFNMRVVGINSDGRAVTDVDKVYRMSQLKELLSESDYVVVIVPLTAETRKLIGEQELKMMKKTAYLINIARGEIVDERALLNALKNRELAGAVLDVFSQEPLSAAHSFWKLDNCLITPHISGRSPKYMERALEIFENNLDRYLVGNFSLNNLVNLGRMY